MSAAKRPLTDIRSAVQIEQELVARAAAWLPQWQFNEIQGDFGRALITIAARMCGRVLDALARTPEKNQRGMLDWLGIVPFPPRAASMPVFFQLAPTAITVTAPQGTRLQASLSKPTIFETLDAVRVVPGTIAALVGANPATDQYFLPSSGLLIAGQPALTQSRWTTLAQADYPPTVLQLSSADGLIVGQILLVAGRQFRIAALSSNVVTLSAPGPVDPSTGAAPASLPAGTLVELLSVFAPFGPTALGAQEHSLLLGDDALLNLSGAATLDVLFGGDAIPASVAWSYWGTSASTSAAAPGWQALTASYSTAGVVILSKDPGATATTTLGGTKTRWLRGTLAGTSSGSVDLSSIQMRVRSGTGVVAGPCPDLAKSPAAFLKYNAMWNNTPIVTSPCFLPLGPMPRLLDAFYIGCAEAFGKAGACVTLCIDAASKSAQMLAAWRSGSMMFGVGKDGRLQRISVGAAAQFLGATQPKESDVAPGPSTGNPITLEVLPTAPPLIDLSMHTVAVLVSSRHRVWMWTERPGSAGFWTPLGELRAPIEGLVALRGARGIRVVALSEGRLRSFDLQPLRPLSAVQWEDLPAPFPEGGDAERIGTVAAVRTAADAPGDALVTVSVSGQVRHYRGGKWQSLDAFADMADPAVAPLALELGKQTAYIVKVRGRQRLAAWRSGSGAPLFYVDCALASGLGLMSQSSGSHGASAEPVAADLTVLMLARPSGEAPRISWWRPFSTEDVEYLYSRHPPPGPRPLAGTPAVLGDLLVTAGADAELFVSRLRPDAHFTVQASDAFSVALFAPGSADLERGDLLVRAPAGKARIVSRVTDIFTDSDGGHVASLDERVSRPDAISGFRQLGISVPSLARPRTARSVVIEGGAPIHQGCTLMLGTLNQGVVSHARLYEVLHVEVAGEEVLVALERDLHLTEKICAWVITAGEVIAASVRPALPLPLRPDSTAPAFAAQAATDAAVAQGAFYSSDSDPPRLDVALYIPEQQPFAVLAANWKRAPKQKLAFDGLVLDSITVIPPSSDSPQLQWQYWNGSGWTPIPGVDDGTDELMQTGTVTFCAPADLAPTSVAGKNDTWIRASLIAGNYGLETYTVTPSPAAGGGTSYTAVPDDDSVNPPKLKSIDISYRVCQAQTPAYVVSFDNGSYDDQSNANRAGSNAVVRAFVPLSEALNLSVAADSSPAATSEVCACGGTNAGSPAASTASAIGATSAAGQALFLGFDRPIDPGAISLLWEVDEENFGAVLPLAVMAVGPAGQSIPLNSGDHTRALGETQVLTVSLSVPLTQINLFGQSLYWLRLQPARAGSWSPQIHAAYLNGVYAAAQETQQLEVLGSSVGAPSAQFSLLRPPVIDGTLELRVQESLSVADRTQLLRQNPDAVLTNPGQLTGDWVLWAQEPDIASSNSTQRVYSLDEVAGVITFGDGINGLVPPVGRNNIIAFLYKRGGGAAANGFMPWGSLSLVSPVQGVSAVLAPEAAAGGSDATAPDSLMRIAPAEIAQRDRVITPRDLEQAALQSSPAIAQARAWQAGGGLRLVTLVFGDDPVPSLAQLRALTAYLTARTTPALAANLDVVAPHLVSTRITILGDVTSFDAAAQVESDVSDALDRLFDPQIGGVDGTGWPLGRAPVNDDVVAALNIVQNLTGIVSITLEIIDSVGNATAMPESFSADQFPVLADAGVQFSVQAAAA